MKSKPIAAAMDLVLEGYFSALMIFQKTAGNPNGQTVLRRERLLVPAGDIFAKITNKLY